VIQLPERSIFIERPPERVFEFVSDPVNDLKWHPPVVEVARTSEGPNALGSTFWGRYDAQRRNLATPVRATGLQAMTAEIVEYVPNERYQLQVKFVDAPKGILAKVAGSELNLTFRVDTAPGGTQLFRGGTFNPVGALAALALLLRPALRSRNDYLLGTIKTILEAD
jgi:uncharacterized protein YndB with AHSA1/START domain